MESQNSQIPPTQNHPPHQPFPQSQSSAPPPSFSAKVVSQVKSNLIFKSKWAELNGAVGDLGTYIPIVVALTLSRDLNLGTTLIFTGVYNIITGAIYGVPMPVQPMKAIAATALANPDFGVPEIMAAGILTGGILLVLGVTGLMKLVYKFIPLCVVRGIQLAQGLSFALTAVKYIKKVQNLPKSKALGRGIGEEYHQRSEGEADADVGSNNDVEGRPSEKARWRKIIATLPSAFLIFVLGVILAFIRKPKIVHEIKFGPSPMEVVKISRHAWKEGFIKGAIPQLPLSILNSVVAVCKLSNDLFPERDFSATSISVTVGLMNVVGSWFGAMPSCHGAGGLAGQYKFGGRSGGCVALLGTAKLVLGLVLGTSLVTILNQFPVGVLGVLLLFAGIELAMCARDMNTKGESFVMLICTAVSLVGSSAALGFVVGMVAYLLLCIRKLGRDKPASMIWMHGGV
ncbi:hypothetical protein GBA52_001173 [Prunus armeniaca]|nr:hypothetical protein GBA52_001173 [Prunus armeniaca]